MFEGEHALGPVLDELSETWRVTEVSHKPYPCGRATHAVVDACLGFRERLGLDRAAQGRCRAGHRTGEHEPAIDFGRSRLTWLPTLLPSASAASMH